MANGTMSSDRMTLECAERQRQVDIIYLRCLGVWHAFDLAGGMRTLYSIGTPRRSASSTTPIWPACGARVSLRGCRCTQASRAIPGALGGLLDVLLLGNENTDGLCFT